MKRTPREVAQSYWDVESARDLEAVARHYHPDATFSPPGQVLVGWDQVRTYYEASFRAFPGLEVKIVHAVSNGNEAALEGEAVLIDHDGRRFPLSGINVVQVEGGKFRSVRAYYDPSALSADPA